MGVCDIVPVSLSWLQVTFMLMKQSIWNQFQAIKSAQHRHEGCGSGIAFSPFGDITPIGGLEVKNL